ncbi:hypothetical protein BDN70DRAFT_877142 [Pholiota conissans]|uniref:Uncharacterized protein n=1 Tax=Pholiota conissans TaxID=109636 RepID=A0A9P5Z4R0_9AGAR|nr:hypothetical protein BDN70DRAFT_877142 [Pholiota conissans]
MRAREIARVARLKAKKEEKRMERERKEKQKFSLPPLSLSQRDHRNRSSSAPISSATTKAGAALNTKVPIAGDNPGTARPKSSSISVTSTLGKQTIAARPKSSSVSTYGKSPFINVEYAHAPLSPTARPRKSSFSTGALKSPDKRVSWASSTVTLDVNGCADVMPISGKSAETSGGATKFVEHLDGQNHDGGPSRKSSLMPIPSHADLLRTIPRARTASPRLSVALDPHSRHGPQMIAVTTQDMAQNWAREADTYDENGYCRCWNCTELQDRVPCDIHAH